MFGVCAVSVAAWSIEQSSLQNNGQFQNMIFFSFYFCYFAFFLLNKFEMNSNNAYYEFPINLWYITSYFLWKEQISYPKNQNVKKHNESCLFLKSIYEHVLVFSHWIWFNFGFKVDTELHW